MKEGDEGMGDFGKYVYSNFSDMPSYKVANVCLRIVGRLINRFDNKGETSISKTDLIGIIKEAVTYETNPRTTVDRLLNRTKKDDKIPEKETRYRVVVRDYENEDYRQERGVHRGLKMAKQDERTVNNTLNHSQFYTFIEHLENGEVVTGY